MRTPFFDVDAIIADHQTKIIICCGAGGVGKTTTSAALALRAAEAGRKVVVLTIDPARRLAQSLGVGELDNTPRPVAGLDATNGGRLDAMMLDMKRTFDDVVIAHCTAGEGRAPSCRTRSTRRCRPPSPAPRSTWRWRSSASCTTKHEADGSWDLIVVDTPPARSALDFLDAPEHLSDLLDGRFLRMLLAPARGPLRLMSIGFHLVSSAMTKILGGQLLRDVQTFVTAFEALFGGFRQRAAQTHALLSSSHTTFLVVATAQRDALREAAYFVDRLTEEQMPLAGLVINRVHASQLDVSAERALAIAEDLDPATAVTEIEALRRHAHLERVIEQEKLLLERFSSTRPDVPRTLVATLAERRHRSRRASARWRPACR